MSDTLLRIEGPILSITFDRGVKRNALNRAMRAALADAVEQLRDRRDLHLLLIRANGPFFSAGIDITERGFAEEADQVRDGNDIIADSDRMMLEWRRLYRRPLHGLLDEMEAIEKPIVVAIQGPCLGLGVELAASADIRLASDQASFALPEVKLGFIAGSGGVSRVTRLCGPSWSKWLNMTGESLDAYTAQMAGFVQAVYPHEEFDERVTAFCERLAARPPEAVAAAKMAVDLCADLDRGNGRNVERFVNTPLVMRATAEAAKLLDVAKAKDG